MKKTLVVERYLTYTLVTGEPYEQVLVENENSYRIRQLSKSNGIAHIYHDDGVSVQVVYLSDVFKKNKIG